MAAGELSALAFGAERVACPFADGLAFPLRYHGHQPDHHPAGGRLRVQALGCTHERAVMPGERVEYVGEVAHTARESIELRDQHGFDLPAADKSEDARHTWAVETSGALAGISDHVDHIVVVDHGKRAALLELVLEG